MPARRQPKPPSSRYDAVKAQRAINFFERILKHGKGSFSGKPFTLLPWQREIIEQLFGVVDADGNRIHREAYIEVPKKNGKSEMAAGIALFMLLADGERGAEVYSAAAARDQAALVFRVAAGMVDASPMLSKHLRVIPSTKSIVKRDDPLSFYKAISADGDIQDGVEPHCVIADESHRWKVSKCLDLYEVLFRGMIARAQPLMFNITTAGVKAEAPLAARLHDRARRKIDGVIDDPTFFARIYTAPVDLDWQSREAREIANPSHERWGGFLKEKVLAAMADKGKDDPVAAVEFRRYHLNIWGQREENRAIDIDIWKENGGERRGLVGRKCWLGVDLASTTDLASVVAIFPADDGTIDVLPFFFLPEDRLEERERKDKVPYAAWRDAEFLDATPGNVIDYKCIQKRIDFLAEVFDVQVVGVDPRMAADFTNQLIEKGIQTVDVTQNFSTLTAPTQKLLALYQARKLRHEGHPVLQWNANCVDSKSDGNEGIKFLKPDRAKSDKRIDGISALVNALAVWMRSVDTGGSVWDDPELAKALS